LFLKIRNIKLEIQNKTKEKSEDKQKTIPARDTVVGHNRDAMLLYNI